MRHRLTGYGSKGLVLVVLLLTIVFFCIGKARAQQLNNYEPLGIGYCEDVGLRCAAMIHKDTPKYYAVFSDEGKLIAITKDHKGKETTVWGRLPPKKGEHDL